MRTMKRRVLASLVTVCVVVYPSVSLARFENSIDKVSVDSVSSDDIFLNNLSDIGKDPVEGYEETFIDDQTEFPSRELSKDEIPEILDPGVLKEYGSINRIYAMEDDLYSAIFQNEDGTRTMYSFSYPIKYLDENGDIQDKHNDIVSLDDDRYVYYTPHNDIQTFFPDRLGEDSSVAVVSGDYEVSFGVVNGSFSEARLPEDEDNRELVYEDVFGEGYSLSYHPQFWGLKEDIVISEDYGKYDFAFYLNAGDLIPVQENNDISLVDEEGLVVCDLSEIMLYDSAEEPNQSFENTVSLESTEIEGIYLYVVSIDRNFLQNESTVFPVYVDPSITINSSGSGSTKTIMDTPVYTGIPSACQGGNLYNVIGNANAWGTGYGVGRTLIKFPGLVNSTIFQGVSQSQVSSMNLYLFSTSGSVNSSYVTFNYYNGNVWDESNTAYNNVNWSGNGALVASATVGSGNNWVSFNIKGAITTWQNSSTAANKGLIITNGNESNTAYAKAFCSTESSYKPYVTLTWSSANSTDVIDGYIYRIKNTYSSKYAKATTSVSVTQGTTPSETRGYELWRFEKQSTGIYWIESLGVRNGTYGMSRNVLTASATDTSSVEGTLSLGAFSPTNSKQQWYVNKTDQGYSFINCYYTKLAVSVPNTNGSVRLTASTGYSKWSLEARMFGDSYINSYSGGTAPYVINVIINSSAIITNLTNNVYSCATAWNNIDPNIIINYYPVNYSGSYASADFTVNVEGESLEYNVMGKMIPDPNNVNMNWTSATIQMSTSASGIDSSIFSPEDRQMTFLHELGHALKLKHPHDNTEYWHPVSIMNQGVPQGMDYIPCRPSGYDMYNLQRKW